MLGGLLLDPQAWDSVADAVVADDFYRPDHRLIFTAIGELVGEGKLFGSIGTADIAESISREGFKVERSEVRLPAGPLRTVGEHVVNLHLHTDVDVPVHVTIVAEE